MPSKDSLSKVTLILEAGENLDFLSTKLRRVISNGQPLPAKIWVICPPRLSAKTATMLSPFQGRIGVSGVQGPKDLLPLLTTPFLAYLPAETPYSIPPFDGLENLAPSTFFVRPWIPPVDLPDTEWARLVYMAFGWVSTPALVELSQGNQRIPTLRDLETTFSNPTPWLPYFSCPAGSSTSEQMGLFGSQGNLSPKSRVLALVPHYKCESWLAQCLYSLVRQTRPPDAIAVLDDASSPPPLEIVRGFSQVTLLRSPENAGPYRLIQTAVDQTHFDAYLFQDADDWSSLDRLECLLGEAERTGADWIGTQELMYFEDSIHALRYPLDLNAAPQSAIRYPFCYPSSLISGNFLSRLGGFATGLRFSGDFELLARAVHAGKVANLDRYAYFRRIRKNSLVTSEETGLASSARKEVDAQVELRKLDNLDRVSKGLPPRLEPLKTAAPVVFEHLAGPALK